MIKKIKKNRRKPFPYFSLPKLIRLKSNKIFGMTKYVEFTNSCLYEFEDGYRGLNKLFGFSDGHHHNNSFRICWRPNKTLDKIELYGYEYRNKERQPYISLCEVNVNEECLISILHIGHHEVIQYGVHNLVTDKVYFVKNHYVLNKCIGYKLNLYFGGKYKAPHDIKIIIDEKSKTI